MKRKLIDHNDSNFSFVRDNNNEKLIRVLKKIKKEKSPTELHKIMESAHRGSPYRPRELNNLSSVFFTKIDGSTGGDCSDVKLGESTPTKTNQLNKRRIKEFTPIMQQKQVKVVQCAYKVNKNDKDGVRYNSVQKIYTEEEDQKQLKRNVRRESNFKESTTVRNHQIVVPKEK
jgi:hypothetical protein